MPAFILFSIEPTTNMSKLLGWNSASINSAFGEVLRFLLIHLYSNTWVKEKGIDIGYGKCFWGGSNKKGEFIVYFILTFSGARKACLDVESLWSKGLIGANILWNEISGGGCSWVFICLWTCSLRIGGTAAGDALQMQLLESFGKGLDYNRTWSISTLSRMWPL